MVPGIIGGGRARLHHHDDPRLVHVGDGGDGARLFHQDGKAGAQVGIGKVDRLAPLVRRGHGGEDQVDPAGLERRNQTLEGHVLDRDRAMDEIAQRMGQVDPHSRRIPAWSVISKGG